ncbi:Uu.00g082380.m01.CDS01 [Anthostomella pinea]|uniref:Uu.00g082380.m01.CDS01 n=1 Tax=Anthostomella pinea TaxID=933095 RepID=A0AAI8YJI8_9PEZI|nr:Uu.00g082380.m01.CDS01 [Anthostomella pinea]
MQHCKNHPGCKEVHRRDEFNLFLVCPECQKKGHPYAQYSDRYKKPKESKKP